MHRFATLSHQPQAFRPPTSSPSGWYHRSVVGPLVCRPFSASPTPRDHRIFFSVSREHRMVHRIFSRPVPAPIFPTEISSDFRFFSTIFTQLPLLFFQIFVSHRDRRHASADPPLVGHIGPVAHLSCFSLVFVGFFSRLLRRKPIIHPSITFFTDEICFLSSEIFRSGPWKTHPLTHSFLHTMTKPSPRQIQWLHRLQ